MGKKQRKNSNYVTEKTLQAKIEKEKAKRRKKIKKVAKQIGIGVLVVLAVAAFICLITLIANLDFSSNTDNDSSNKSTGTSGFGSTNLKADDSYLNDKAGEQDFEATHHVTMVIEGYENYPITIELYGNEAPITVDNFVKLIEEGFYDGLTFHRATDGFMAQGGGYDVSGNKIEADTIKGEFSENGVDNPIKHVAGVISMARLGSDNDSASSEFFIVDETSASNTASLDGKYAAFGRVTDGFEVIKDICDKATSEIISIDERPVIKSITYHSHADGEDHH